MVDISIPKHILDEAVEHSKERMKYEYNRFNLEYEAREDKVLVGTIGQLVFELFLKNKAVIYEHEYQAGAFDQFDFKVNGYIIDVKTSSYYGSYSYLNLLYEETQFQNGLRKGYNYCTQVFINGKNRETGLLELENCNRATISGYINFNEIINYRNERQHYGDDYKVPIRNLNSIDSLLDIFNDK